MNYANKNDNLNNDNNLCNDKKSIYHTKSCIELKQNDEIDRKYKNSKLNSIESLNPYNNSMKTNINKETSHIHKHNTFYKDCNELKQIRKYTKNYNHLIETFTSKLIHNSYDVESMHSNEIHLKSNDMKYEYERNNYM